LNLGWFKPLHEAIPELAAIPSTREANGHAEQPNLQ
jgi:hypothetical protein